MNGVDLLLAKQPHESLQACRVDRPSDTKDLGGYSCSPEEIAKPTNSIRRAYGHDGVPSLAKLLGETKYHHLRAAGAVGLEHHRDPQGPSGH
jgi:hypothetical protein